jgi:hypothetical protein
LRFRAIYLSAVILVSSSVILLPLLFQVNVPEHDQWDLVPEMSAWSGGDFRLEAIWQPYGEHMMFLPRLLMILAGRPSHWNMYVESLLSGIMLMGSALLLGRAACRHYRERGLDPLHGIVAVALLTLAPNRAPVYMWGWQMQVSMALLFTTSSIIILSGSRDRLTAVLTSLLLAVAASLSFGAGLAVWPAGLFMLMSGKRRGRWIGTAVWSAGAAAMAVLYSFNLSGGDAHSLTAIPGTAIYGLVFLGAPLGSWAAALPGWGLVIPAVLGAAVLTVFLLLLRRSHLLGGGIGLWQALGITSLAAALLAGAGRSSFGYGQALALRYVPFSSLIWLSVYLMMAEGSSFPAKNGRLPGIIRVLGLVLLLMSSLHGMYYCRERMFRLRPAAEMLRRGEFRQAAPGLMADAEKLERFSGLLRDHGLSVFAR